MSIKHWFRAQSYWLRGGIIIPLLAFIVFLILLPVGDRWELDGGFLTFPAFSLPLLPVLWFTDKMNPTIVITILLLFYFFTGVFLGLLFTAWKKFIKGQQVRFFQKIDAWYFIFILLIIAIPCVGYIINNPYYFSKKPSTDYLKEIAKQKFDTDYFDPAMGIKLKHPSSVKEHVIFGHPDEPKNIEFLTQDNKQVFRMQTLPWKFNPQNGYTETSGSSAPKENYSPRRLIDEVSAAISPEELYISPTQLTPFTVTGNKYFTYLWGYEDKSWDKSLVGGGQYVILKEHYGCTLELRFSSTSTKLIEGILQTIVLTPPEFDCETS